MQQSSEMIVLLTVVPTEGGYMAEHRRVEDVLTAIVDREQIHGLVEPRVPSALKYKRGRNRANTVHLPDLKVGTKLVLTCASRGPGPVFTSYGTVTGYALGIVLDFYSRGGEKDLYYDAYAIVQIVKVTHPDLLNMVGHLRSVSVGDYHTSTRFVPEQVQQSDFKWLEAKEER